MKKITALLLVALLSITLCACESKNTSVNSETYNGITKTVTETTINGKTEVTVEYTDENGKVLDEAEGKALFEGTKAEVEDSSADVEEVEVVETEEAVEEETAEEEVIEAALTFKNNTDVDITGLYFVLAEESDWGENILEDDYVLEAGGTGSLNEGSLTYVPDTAWSMAIAVSDGNEIAFENFTIGNLNDPQNVTITITKEDDQYSIEIE